MMVPLHQHQFSGQVASLPLIHLEVEIAKRPAADTFNRLGGLFISATDDLQDLRAWGMVGGEDLADADIRCVEGILLPEAASSLPLHNQGVFAFLAEVYSGKQVQQSAVVHVSVGNQCGFPAGVKPWNQSAEQGERFLPVAGVACVHKEIHALMLQNTDVAAAGGLDEGDMEIIPPWGTL